MRHAFGWLVIVLVAFGAPASAQARTSHQADNSKPASAVATPAPADNSAGSPAANKQSAAKADSEKSSAKPPTPDDICHAIEQDAAENDLPVEFFARVIWQESRFNAQAVSNKGAEGIAQFMPATASFRGLSDPFDPIAALHESASYLGDLKKQFGNLGLAAAGYMPGLDA